ncbi:MAG: type VI secretion system ATPase TssH, partial [Chitinivibrionales bacterium]|nr:type VI secretion system ATPase TssH [Chitinivibrionales bacterium]
MLTTDVRTLLTRLNPLCTAALEAAVGACVNRGNPELRWEHLLRTLATDSRSDIAAVLRRFDIDSAQLQRGLDTELSSLPTGASGKPVFSPVLLEIIERAWSIATLRLEETSVCSAALLLAAADMGVHAMT